MVVGKHFIRLVVGKLTIYQREKKGAQKKRLIAIGFEVIVVVIVLPLFGDILIFGVH